MQEQLKQHEESGTAHDVSTIGSTYRSHTSASQLGAGGMIKKGTVGGEREYDEKLGSEAARFAAGAQDAGPATGSKEAKAAREGGGCSKG